MKSLQQNGKTLALVLPWLQSKQQHFEKYCSIYTNLGFDVLVVQIDILQLMRPEKGSQILAADVVKFLNSNDHYENILVHGFSVGGYLWSECLIHLNAHKSFKSISSRIKGQVWDSVTGLKEIPIGISKSVFSEGLMENLLRKSVEYYLKFFYENATKYYVRAENFFNDSPVKAPALIYSSKADPIGTETKANEIAESFKQQNIDLSLKCFEDSPHVQHYQKYKEEYLKYLHDHLKKCNLIE